MFPIFIYSQNLSLHLFEKWLDDWKSLRRHQPIRLHNLRSNPIRNGATANSSNHPWYLIFQEDVPGWPVKFYNNHIILGHPVLGNSAAYKNKLSDTHKTRKWQVGERVYNFLLYAYEHVTSTDQSEASIEVTWPVLTNQRPVLRSQVQYWPIRGQYSGHMDSFDPSEDNILGWCVMPKKL